MTTAVANPDEFGFGKFIGYSLFLHGLLAATIVASIVFQWRGNAWGGVGGASEGDVKVNLVGSVGLPMPKPPVVDDSRTFDPTNSLYKEQLQPKPPELPKDVTKIPKFEKEKPPKEIEHKSKVFESKAPPPPNAVSGHGGQMNVPTGYAQTPGAASNGVAVSGQGGGDFAARYPAYVEAIRRRIAQNWLQSSIDPAARASRSIHAVATFSIYRDGTVKDIRITETSRNASFDNSGLRALYDSNPMPPLPADYSGSYVAVTFDFLPPGSHY
jgi:outer membrane biosynthesis protein TonB